MLTDAPPRKVNRAGFLESDRIKTLDLPQDGHLREIAHRLESAMRSERTEMLEAPAQSFWKPSQISMKHRPVMSGY
jgi:hypothetical protein